ncbi:sporulation protein [Bacillus methanolicus]|uniref:Sporulation control protein n=1 Tax=Bacillus methanolicus (strain MGA3 / ATCC 53907) TaxID=796606 RepID=I3E9J7_BACMM|nr:sporulation protein [Bacillus methanolicus]AIE60416.1 sporulation control protein [Bacillus methanolicus MGA3]EIJ83168.1 Sporulation control protein [Bacillus methanolicus MGA3]
MTAGEEVRGVVEIRGGSIEQKIDEIYLGIYTTFIKKVDDKKLTDTALIDRIRLTESFTIKPNKTEIVPFSFWLSNDTPITAGRTKIWISTGLDIKNAVDPTDKDFIKVLPSPFMNAVFQAISNLGFRLREAECVEAPYRLRRRLPIIQEFEFVPVSGPFRGRLDELELIFFPSSGGAMDIIMQVDLRARGLGGFLAEALEMDEKNVRLTISQADIPNIQQKISSVIKRFS